MVTIADVGPTPSSFVGATPQRSGSGRMLCLAISADGQRLYAGSFAGVWRSDDGGQNWRQMIRPQPVSLDVEVSGALFAPWVIDIAVSSADPNLVLAACEGSYFSPSRNGIYRSLNGGETWTLVQPVSRALQGTLPNGLAVSQVVFAPDNPMLAFAPLGMRMAISSDAGKTWDLRPLLGNAWHVAVGPLEAGGVRRVYGAGDNMIWRSVDGGQSWMGDPGANVVVQSRANLLQFQRSVDPQAQLGGFAGRTGVAVAPGAQALAIAPDNPQHIFLAAVGGTFGPSYFATIDGFVVPDGTACNTIPQRLAGEGSLWFGDFTNFSAAQGARWEAVPAPPTYFGTTTPSGKAFVTAKPTPGGYLLFFADLSHVHVSAGRPKATTAWHRLDGRNASASKRMNALANHVFVHPDPHALVTTADFAISLKLATGTPSPYDLNSELDQHLGGRLLMANDGGVQWSDDGGVTWQPAHGLHTVDAINVAGLAKPDQPPALYIGTGDNDSFFTRDGGANWRDCSVHLGDADAWFADLSRFRAVQFAPRAGGIFTWTGDYPDVGGSSNRRFLPTPTVEDEATKFVHNAVSAFVVAGSSPLIRTLATEAHPPDGDYVLIANRSNGVRVLFRTLKASSIDSPDDWEQPSSAMQIGPPLPAGATVVQACGGHAKPVYYVSDGVDTRGSMLWKFDPTAPARWRVIVPGGPAGRSASVARRFFADPFNPQLIYLLDSDRVRVSVDGGESWLEDARLTSALTGGGKLSIASPDILRNILFVRTERRTRFVVGAAGVLGTIDGLDWQPLHSAIAMPGLPESAFFDGIMNPHDRTLYVSFSGRSILRLGPVPGPPAPQPGLPELELAAILHEA